MSSKLTEVPVTKVLQTDFGGLEILLMEDMVRFVCIGRNPPFLWKGEAVALAHHILAHYGSKP